MKMIQMKPKLGIKQYILLLTLLPSLLITTALTTYIVVSRQADAQEGLLTQSGSAINYLAKAAELPLFSGDQLALGRLAWATVSGNSLKSVTFFDSEKKEILTAGNINKEYKIYTDTSLYQEEQDSQWLLQIPVYNSEIEVADFPDTDGKEVTEKPLKFLGWVQVIADKTRLKEKQRSILLAGAGIGTLVFSLLALLASRFAYSLTRPLDRITKTVKELESGDLSARVNILARGEMNDLIHGINLLANEVEQSNESLQKNVDLATVKLTHALGELEQKNKQLEKTGTALVKASKAKDNFLASASHELRTPLTSILGYCRLLKKTKLPKAQTEHVNVIYQASTMLLSLIDDILDFSKLKSKSINLEHLPFNLKSLFDEVLYLHMPAAKDKGLDLKLVIEQNVPLDLVGDEFKIKQVINNIIRNAIKFTLEGSVNINVSLLDSRDDLGLVFSVEDTGIGIDDKDMAQLFQPFQQVDSSISRRFGGTGLGLIISKRLVELLGGEVRITSQKGKGTKVSFSVLKIYKQLVKKELPADSQIDFGSVANTQLLSGASILIAEDNLLIRNLLKEILESEGAKVTAVENGAEAVERCQRHSLDLVILDYHMPVLDGIRACEAIRESFSSKMLPVFLLTADIVHARKIKAIDFGINKVIHKPIDEKGLLQSVCQYTAKATHRTFVYTKVLDSLSDEVILDEIGRLKNLLQDAYQAKQNNKNKKIRT